MSYEPTEWKTGDIVTSEKLNKVENGLASVVMTINATIYSETITGSSPATGVDVSSVTATRIRMDKTAGEIYEAFRLGTRCLLVFPEGTETLDKSMTFTAISPITLAGLFTNPDTGESIYGFVASNPWESEAPIDFYATSADAYPSTGEPEPGESDPSA